MCLQITNASMTSTLAEIYRANRELNAKTQAFQIYMGGCIFYRNIPLTGITASGLAIDTLYQC